MSNELNAEQLEALKVEGEAAEMQDAGAETKIKIDGEFVERLEENIAKGFEKVEASMKKFSFHGSEKDNAEVKAAMSERDQLLFVKAVATGNHDVASKMSADRAKTLNVTTDANGGYLVPDVFETEVYATFDGYSEIIRDADVQNFNRPGNTFKLNELDARVTAFWVDENSTGLTASTPSYSEPTIATRDLIASVDWTQDFQEDNETNILQSLTQQIGEEFANKVQAYFISSTATVSGVYQPGLMTYQGTVSASTVNGYIRDFEIGATATGYTGIAANDLETLYYNAISIDHFQDANKDGKFYLNGLTMLNLRKNIRAATNDRDYITVFDPVNQSILGRPIVVTNQMPVPATTTSNPFVLYGNLNRHLKVRRKRGLTLKVNTMGTSASGRQLNYQLGSELVASQRIGFAIVLPEGLTRLVT